MSRTELKKVTDQLEELKQAEHKALEARGKLEELKLALIKKIILEEKLLQTIDWHLNPSILDNPNCSLLLVAMNDNPGLAELVCGDRWTHTLYDLDGADLTIGDSDTYLSFKDKDMVKVFVKKYGLKLDSSSLDERILHLENQIQAVKNLYI